MTRTDVWTANAKAHSQGHRLIINQGGTSSSKTYSILQLLFLIAAKHTKLISIVSETLPHLKRGAMRDFFKIVEEEEAYVEANHNRTDHTYRVNDSTIEFFSADNPAKVRGARRDILYINECNNVSWSTFEQMEVRTKERIFLDFNPVSSFWAHEKLLPRDDTILIKSTYRDALDVLPDSIVRAIEARKDSDPNWWRVYGEGEVGQLEGLIYSKWDMIDAMPEDYKWLAYGLDFGYTNDPTALIAVARQGDVLYLDELIYQTSLTNDDIYKSYDAGRAEIVADSAEPKSIEELRRMGWNIRGANKGKDSIANGIDILKRFELKVTKRSVNLIKELRNYTWAEDRDGNYLNKPIDDHNHALDAVRYVALNKIGTRKPQIIGFG